MERIVQKLHQLRENAVTDEEAGLGKSYPGVLHREQALLAQPVNGWLAPNQLCSRCNILAQRRRRIAKICIIMVAGKESVESDNNDKLQRIGTH